MIYDGWIISWVSGRSSRLVNGVQRSEFGVFYFSGASSDRLVSTCPLDNGQPGRRKDNAHILHFSYKVLVHSFRRNTKSSLIYHRPTKTVHSCRSNNPSSFASLLLSAAPLLILSVPHELSVELLFWIRWLHVFSPSVRAPGACRLFRGYGSIGIFGSGCMTRRTRCLRHNLSIAKQVLQIAVSYVPS
jgi:hypothetical protein